MAFVWAQAVSTDSRLNPGVQSQSAASPEPSGQWEALAIALAQETPACLPTTRTSRLALERPWGGRGDARHAVRWHWPP